MRRAVKNGPVAAGGELRPGLVTQIMLKPELVQVGADLRGAFHNPGLPSLEKLLAQLLKKCSYAAILFVY